MNGENPYAPPAVAETEAGSSRYWRLDDAGILVKHGATLPKVDLETGISGEEAALRAFPRKYQNITAGSSIYFIFVYLLIIGGILFFEINGMGVFLVFLVGLILARRIKACRGSSSGIIVFWSFTEERRAKRATLRRWIRMGALVILVAGLFVSSLETVGGFADGFLRLYLFWLGLMIALAVWSYFDSPKYKIRAADPGWLRIAPVHPKALEFLSRVESDEPRRQTDGLPRKRLIRTVYLYRFPLRMLIGRIHRNPLMILQIALMKLLRSRLLVREAYHFSEAEDVSLSDLCPPLREACDTWLATHPNWIVVSGERIPSPAGDLVVETAHLAAPGLEHCLRVTRAWMLHTPEKSANQFTFLTWIDDGTEHISTCDQPFIALKSPHLHHRANGTPEEVYQAHLGHVAGFSIHLPQDVPALLRLLQIDKEESDRLLVERKIQSEVRETAG